MEKELLELLKEILKTYPYELRFSTVEKIKKAISDLEAEPVAHILFNRIALQDGSDIYELKKYLKVPEQEYEILKNVKID